MVVERVWCLFEALQVCAWWLGRGAGVQSRKSEHVAACVTCTYPLDCVCENEACVPACMLADEWAVTFTGDLQEHQCMIVTL